jgi:hypothetical protein
MEEEQEVEVNMWREYGNGHFKIIIIIISWKFNRQLKAN